MQEKFKFNIEFRYQIIVSAVKFSNSFAKILIPIGALSGLSDLHIVKINIICVYRQYHLNTAGSKMHNNRTIV